MFSFKNNTDRKGYTGYFLPKEKNEWLWCYDWRAKPFLTTSKKKELRTYDNIENIPSGQKDSYTNDCLLEYPRVLQRKLQ